MGPEKKYYIISDLHIGGAGELEEVKFQSELVTFLDSLCGVEGAELIIAGDFFGLWELSTLEGPDQLAFVLNRYNEILQAFKRAGESVKITYIVGNHDHSILGYPKAREELKRFNIDLDNAQHLVREINGEKIWIEHGHQHDKFNAIEQPGSPLCKPLGFYITRYVLSLAGLKSSLGRKSWLANIQCVQPLEAVPKWMFSNYFYLEMNPLLRLAILPFLLFFAVSIVLFGLGLLDIFGIDSVQYLYEYTLRPFGIFGDVIDTIITIDIVILLIFIVVSLPLFLIYRDFRAAIKRYGLKYDKKEKARKDEVYLEAAMKTFESDRSVRFFVFGHTHEPFLKKMGQKYIMNTGTWLERQQRIKSFLWPLPSIFYPTYDLNYFLITSDNSKTVIEYRRINKKVTRNLTMIQRFLISIRKKPGPVDIPEKTVVKAVKNTDQ